MTPLKFEGELKHLSEWWVIGNNDLGVIFEQKEARIGMASFKWSFLVAQNYKKSPRTYNPCDKLAVLKIWNSKNIDFKVRLSVLWKYGLEIHNMCFDFQARDRKNINWYFLLSHCYTRARAREFIFARSQFCAKSIRKVEQGRPGTDPSWAS